MWTKVGGRHANKLAWLALMALVGPAFAISIVYQNAEPIVFVGAVLGSWIVVAMVALLPIAAVKFVARVRLQLHNDKN
jgi:predicted aconitase with swiveling domain